ARQSAVRSGVRALPFAFRSELQRRCVSRSNGPDQFFLRLADVPKIMVAFKLCDIRETIQKTGAADLLAGNAACDCILASS
ncbi:MAG TPA: hypothetical protein VE133_10240, partial [Candidatus Sulfotelmatobacter sp.]|nr:hypothetical protein [Candidatus Sulfotelmatobacter sp.]